MVLGMVLFIACFMLVTHVWTAFSISTVVWFSRLFKGILCCSVCVNVSQSAFLVTNLSSCCMYIGVVERVKIIGRWSEEVMGPGCEYVFKKWCLFEKILSGFVAEFSLINVGKCGPRCSKCPWFMSLASEFPTVLLVLLPKQRCVALKSPSMYVGVVLLSSVCMSGSGR